MGNKLLMKGNEVIAEAAVRAGCRFYFGYPITPQTEIGHYMAKRLPEMEGAFVQAESEIAAINMVYGAAAAGARVMTSSSSPGISLKQECLSYIAGAELPAVIVNIVRCGPGLGGILPAQCDYFQAVKGGGHGDYNMVVIAPYSIQEMYELTVEAFNISDRYRIATMIMADGNLGQMMEVVKFKDEEYIEQVEKNWAANGTEMKRENNVITSIYLEPEVLERHNLGLQAKYRKIENDEVIVEEWQCDDADIILISYGSMARIVEGAVKSLREDGVKAGLIRPITLWPFPKKSFEKYNPKSYLTIEMSAGQMVQDVRLAVNGKTQVDFYGRMGGCVPSHEEIVEKVKNILSSK